LSHFFIDDYKKIFTKLNTFELRKIVERISYITLPFGLILQYLQLLLNELQLIKWRLS